MLSTLRPTFLPTRRVWPLALVLLASCASYPQRTEGALRDFQRGHFGAAQRDFADEEVTGSAFLSGAEAGTVALAAGDWEAARRHLHRATAEVEEIEQKALVDPEGFAEGLASWVFNDTTQRYEGEGFERVYVHAALALAYLAVGKLDDVYVEARLGNRLLEAEEELYEKEYRAGGLGHLVSAVAYELLDQPDQAYIDYRRMEEKGVGTALAGRALVRLANDLGRREDIAHWEELYGPYSERPEGAANIVVIAGVGLGPFKTESSLAVPTADGLVAVAVPGMAFRPQAVESLLLVAEESGASVRTDVVEDVSRVANENLEDRLAWTVSKSVARGFIKREITKELEDEYGAGGRLIGDLFAIVTERADLRSWTTLPDSWQACRMFLPSGRHSLSLEAIGGEAHALGTFELDPGETLIILARTIGTRLHAYPIGGVRVDEPIPDAAGEVTSTATVDSSSGAQP
jgi:hypothetical protein